MFISDHEPSVAATETALATTDGLIVSGTTNGAADAAIANPLATITVPCKGVLRQYLDASPECVELFTLWERAGAAATNRLAAAVMKVLACVLRYGTPALRVALARKVLRTKSKSVLSAIAGSNASASAAAQELCTAVIRVGPHYAREFVARFNLAFKPFASHTSAGDVVATEYGPVRLRTGNVVLIVALLECGAVDVIQEVCSTKGTLFSVFKGLPSDGDGVVLRVVRCLTAAVVGNPKVSKRLKLDVFTGPAVQVRGAWLW